MVRRPFINVQWQRYSPFDETIHQTMPTGRLRHDSTVRDVVAGQPRCRPLLKVVDRCLGQIGRQTEPLPVLSYMCIRYPLST